MICPTCKEENLKSTVETYGGWTTFVSFPSFYDELGRYHHHDDNSRTTSCKCSNGHEFKYRYQNKCWCGWVGMEEKYIK